MALFACLAFSSKPTFAESSCEKEHTTWPGVRACESSAMQQTLDETYADTQRYVQSKDPKAAALLRKAQDSWQRFSKDSCDYSLAAAEMNKDAEYNCYMDFMGARIKILKSYKHRFGKASW